MKMSMVEHFNAARDCSMPLVAIRTPDVQATLKTIVLYPDYATVPMETWDCVRGLTAINPPALKLHAAMTKQVSKKDTDYADPLVMLQAVLSFPEGGILFMINLHRFLTDVQVVQSIWNLRDMLKARQIMLVLLSPDIILPPEIASDFLVLDEPLPDEAQLAGIIKQTIAAVRIQGVDVPEPSKAEVDRCVEALSGLPAFPAEQVSAKSARKTGIDIEQLWEWKYQAIEQVPGLSIYRGKEKFADITGQKNIKKFHLLRGDGPMRRRGVVFLDEVDKHLAGFGAVGTGDTTAEMAGALLTYMEDIKAEGCLLLGIAGGGKTLFGHALANEWGVPCINYDFSAMKGGIVGQSGANIRGANKVVSAITQDYPYFVATCNNIDNIPPELRRRFTSATFFFDLMTREEKDKAWELYEEKYNEERRKLKIPIVKYERPEDKGWTGAEIRNCHHNAFVLNTTLLEAATYTVPISESASEKIKALRTQADGRFISASYSGKYVSPDGKPDDPAMLVAIMMEGGPKRKINTGGRGGGSGLAN